MGLAPAWQVEEGREKDAERTRGRERGRSGDAGGLRSLSGGTRGERTPPTFRTALAHPDMPARPDCLGLDNLIPAAPEPET